MPAPRLEEVERWCRRLGVDGWELRAEPVLRGGIAGTRLLVDVDDAHRHPHRRAVDVFDLIGAAGLPPRVESRALATFRLLAEVEGRLHGVPSRRGGVPRGGGGRLDRRHRRGVRGARAPRRRRGRGQLRGAGQRDVPRRARRVAQPAPGGRGVAGRRRDPEPRPRRALRAHHPHRGGAAGRARPALRPDAGHDRHGQRFRRRRPRAGRAGEPRPGRARCRDGGSGRPASARTASPRWCWRPPSTTSPARRSPTPWPGCSRRARTTPGWCRS